VGLWAQSPLVLHDGQVRYRAETAAWLLEDPRAAFTISGVSAPGLAARFRPGPAEGFNFGFTSKGYWVRLRVQSQASTTTWLLKVQNSALGQAVLYAPAGTDTTRFVAQPASLAYPFAQRLVKHRVPVFELPLAPGEARTFYLYFAGGGPVHFPLEILSARQFAEKDHLEGLLQGVYFGLMFVMIFYNLFLYLSIKDPSYLYYLFYVASFGILQASMNGIAYQYVWPTPSWWADHCVPGVHCHHHWLRFAVLHELPRPEAEHALFSTGCSGVLIGPSGVGRVLTVVAFAVREHRLGDAAGNGLCGAGDGRGCGVPGAQYRPALFLLVAWSALLLGIVLFALNNLGVLPGTFLTTYGVQIGSALDVVLLSLALADRINLLQRERLRVEGEKVQAEQSKKVKEAFLAAVSHEIRTPINAITGFARLLETAGLLPQHHEYARHIRVSADNLLAIVNDVLDLSKLDAGKLHFERAEIDLDDLVRLLFQTICFGVNDKGLRATYQLDPRIPAGLLGDPVRLNQILLNLLGNAVKFTHQGEVSLSVRLLREDAQGVTLQFRVSDTGIGIPADKLATIFESYSQASKQTTRLYGGTGLGLTITKQLVELQGGTIGVESRVGAGTVFTVTLPLARNLGPARPKGTETTHSVAIPGALRSVLLVDDNALNLIVARHTLQYWRPGLSVHAVGSGAECLESLREGAYDLVLLDLQMPDMDGFETARCIRAPFRRLSTPCPSWRCRPATRPRTA
jgi:signal transduction histidine kinase